MNVTIRAATTADAELIVTFIRELAEFERAAPGEVKVTAQDIIRHGFGERARFECLIAEQDGEAVGFALFFYNFSTWEGCPGIYLEDIFVREASRASGAGRALMAALARVAIDRGCARLDFSVLGWNPARQFYGHLGARHMDAWMPYRLCGDALTQLASMNG